MLDEIMKTKLNYSMSSASGERSLRRCESVSLLQDFPIVSHSLA